MHCDVSKSVRMSPGLLNGQEKGKEKKKKVGTCDRGMQDNLEALNWNK